MRHRRRSPDGDAAFVAEPLAVPVALAFPLAASTKRAVQPVLLLAPSPFVCFAFFASLLLLVALSPFEITVAAEWE